MAHYDQDVVFVSEYKPNKKPVLKPADDKLINAKRTELEQMIYSLYEISNDQEKSDFLKNSGSPIKQFMSIIAKAS